MGVNFEQITQSIVEAIEAGVDGYRMPWIRTGAALETPLNGLSGRPYGGINILLLWAEANRCGYRTGRWATYQQWLAAGARVQKGQRGTSVLLWKPAAPTSDRDAEADTTARRGRYWRRSFVVFNADQVEGGPSPRKTRPPLVRLRRAERFFLSLPVTIREGGDRACYMPSTDTILMPPFEQFKTSAAYYGVLAHELVHWTGASGRINRDLSGRFGTEAYAMEELIAELGAAFLTAELELDTEPRRDHAPYIKSWLTALKRDPRAIFTAATQAQAAVRFLTQLAEGQDAAGNDRAHAA